MNKSLLAEPPDKARLKTWKKTKEGKYFYSLLAAQREDLKDEIASGYFLNSDSIDSSAQHMAKAVGMFEQLTYVLEILDELGEPEEAEE